jgi:uncharacterized YigZ family protein
MRESYKTISRKSDGLYKEKGSKFIGLAFPVVDEESVKVNLEAVRKQFYDARHHCYAYVLGHNYEHFRANDDGEPNHSAGDPILGQIRSKDLTNTLVVVVRYFGGTKLGVGGLINAYKTATEEALVANSIIEVSNTEPLKIRFAYDVTNEVMRLVNEFELEIVEQKYETDCSFSVNVKIGLIDQVREKLQLLKDMRLDVNFK